MIQLLPQPQREMNRRRWSFRFSIPPTLVMTAVTAWNMTPADWHPDISQGWRVAIIVLATLLGYASLFSHQVAQPTLQQPEKKP